MKKFNELFRTEFIECIESLIGIKVDVEQSNIPLPKDKDCILISIETEDYKKLDLILDNRIVRFLSKSMMGEDLTPGKVKIDDDDLDAIKEIISTVFGAIQNTLSIQKEIKNHKFKIINVYRVKSKEKYNFSNRVDYSFSSTIKGNFILLTNRDLDKSKNVEIPNNKKVEKPSILDNIKVPLRVRIKKTKMLLEDLNNLKVGTIKDLDVKSFEPLEILAGDVLIGYGEAVLVDDNFGIQITELIGD